MGFRYSAIISLVFFFVSAFAWGEVDLYLDPHRMADHTAAAIFQTGGFAGDASHVKLKQFTEALAIANGFSPRYSAKREALMSWMLEKPDGSIMPHELVARATRITGGDALAGLMLSWDILREGWNRMPRRNALEHTLKLKDITGEQDYFNGNFVATENQGFWRRQFGLPVRSESIVGDNFSAWYHFMGTALNSYVVGLKTTPGIGQFQTQALITIQEYLAANRFYENQKRIRLDRAGADFGAALLRRLRNSDRVSEKLEPYLYEKPGAHGRSYGKVRDGDSDTMMKQLKRLRALPNESLMTAAEELLAKPIQEEPDKRPKTLIEKLSINWKTVDTPESIVRAHAVKLLSRLGDERSRDKLIELLDHPAWSVREAAIEALALRKVPELLDHAAKLQEDSAPHVREAFLRAMVHYPATPRTDSFLRKGLLAEDYIDYAAASEVALADSRELSPRLREHARTGYGIAETARRLVASEKASIIQGRMLKFAFRRLLPIAIAGAAGACKISFALMR